MSGVPLACFLRLASFTERKNLHRKNAKTEEENTKTLKKERKAKRAH
jgi:hypothetical protein